MTPLAKEWRKLNYYMNFHLKSFILGTLLVGVVWTILANKNIESPNTNSSYDVVATSRPCVYIGAYRGHVDMYSPVIPGNDDYVILRVFSDETTSPLPYSSPDPPPNKPLDSKNPYDSLIVTDSGTTSTSSNVNLISGGLLSGNFTGFEVRHFSDLASNQTVRAQIVFHFVDSQALSNQLSVMCPQA